MPKNRLGGEIDKYIQDGFFSLDRKWRFTYLNDRALKMLGRRAEEIIGAVIWQECPGIFDVDFESACRQAMKKQLLRHVEIRNVQKGDWYNIRIFPSTQGVSVYWQDISGQRRAEEALRESESLFHIFADSQTQAVWETDAAGRAVKDSPSWRAYTGQKPEEWLGLGWLDAVHPDDREETLKKWREDIAAERNNSTQYRIKGPDGGWKWSNCVAVPLRDREGKVQKWVGMNIDIHQQKLAEEALQASEEKYRRIVETANEGIAMIDAEGRITFINEILAGWLGYSVEEALGKYADQFIGDDDPEKRAADFENHKKKSRERYELQAVTKKGERLWLSVGASAIADQDGNFRGGLAMFSDVTDRKRYELALREAKERQAFILKLEDALRPLRDPAALLFAATRLLGETLGADRALYGEFTAGGEIVKCQANYAAAGLRPIEGRRRISLLGPRVNRQFEAGSVFFSPDLKEEACLKMPEKSVCAALDIRAHITAPLVKEGQLKAVLSVQQSRPRPWTPFEIALVGETAERAWSALERARAEDRLRRSEERYRNLFDAVSAGFAIVEISLDEHKKPLAYRCLDPGAAQDRLSGLKDLIGQRLRAIRPQIEDYCLETYAKSSASGQPPRCDDLSCTVGLYFDARPARTDGEGGDKIALVFNNIT